MNSNQLIDNAEALRLFFNDDVYLVGDLTAIEQQVSKTIESTSNAVSEEKNEVQLPVVHQPEVVAALPKIAELAESYQSTFNFKYLGKNEKAILILVNDIQNPVSTPQGTELLRKLVLSINLKNADFALVNYAAYTSAKFEHLSSFFSCELMISFGVSAASLGLNDQVLHQLNVLNETKMIFTHNLHDLDTDIPAKKTLWGTLKKLSGNSGQ